MGPMVLKKTSQLQLSVDQSAIYATDHCSCTTGNYQLCLNFCLSYMNVHNAKYNISDITQQYPPKSEKFVLEWTKVKAGAQLNAPFIDSKILLGMIGYVIMMQ